MLLNHYNGISLLFKGLIVKNFRELPNNSFEVSLEMSRQEQICPYCHNKTNKIKDYRIQNFKDAQIFGNYAFISLKKRRYFCSHCHKSFTESNPLIYRYQHFSSRFYALVYKEFQSMQSFKAIATRIGVSVTSIIRWFDVISFSHPKLPTCFSIDKFKGNAEGEKFQCNISDPITHKVLDILPSRTVENLCAHFSNIYTKEERNKVQI
ncbi:transposase family protein [uncultured Phascolarctobacterium sp.]|uniref:transposase family protein n=1 Tax=uncultured Phascolarctobacterium sp. TaxID=512296 RepID=UPI0026068034|nr:transposase family protein [uncultured Phascolarctobacterium sp.]